MWEFMEFMRSLFPPNPWGKVQQPEPPQAQAEPDAPAPSIYDSLIEGLEGDIAGLASLRDLHENKLDTVETTLDRKREQLAVLTAHRNEERREDRRAAFEKRRELLGYVGFGHAKHIDFNRTFYDENRRPLTPIEVVQALASNRVVFT